MLDKKEKEERTAVKGTRKVYLSSRCGVHQFCELIDNLCDGKKRAIEEIGFGALLHLKKHKLKLNLLEQEHTDTFCFWTFCFVVLRLTAFAALSILLLNIAINMCCSFCFHYVWVSHIPIFCFHRARLVLVTEFLK
ncbi:unnamed protein product [Linum tenue]|uniref:Uncharacterized protein n=1 Tax=Linum tenue TaxID=586396 RepID=A0AAV0R064_9ROSI|nr:unnamed protein product [Linum tenue]